MTIKGYFLQLDNDQAAKKPKNDDIPTGADVRTEAERRNLRVIITELQIMRKRCSSLCQVLFEVKNVEGFGTGSSSWQN